MSLILNIDTSTSSGSICLAEDGKVLFESSNDVQKEHAGWLHPAIKSGLAEIGRKITGLDAIGITSGPGSYTGLRISMATAKGLCFALNIPLIAVNTLEAMASIAVNENTDYICPMIDARRMEVFTALYDRKLAPIIEPCAMILDENSFFSILREKRILFLGNGKIKFEQITSEKNALFKSLIFNAASLSPVTHNKFIRSNFASLSLIEVSYLKEYYGLFVSKS